MDFWCWLRDVGERIWGFFAKPVHQTLTLIGLTVFVLGVQLTIVCTDGVTGLAPAYITLLLLYQVKFMGILSKEIKEMPNDVPSNLPPTDG